MEIALPVGDPTCHFGGTEIDSGTDDGANGGIANDGILQPGEITSQHFSCDVPPPPPPPMPASLVATVPMPANDASCPNGGTIFETGLDNGANGGIANDGILEPGEVTSTSYLCVEQPVPPVSPVTLLLVTPLMAGDPHCTYGGTEYQTGLDNGANGGVAGDGILESGEVTQTSYMCLGSPT